MMDIGREIGATPRTHVVLLNPRAQKAHRRLPLSVLFAARGIPKEMSWEIIDANIMPDAHQRLDAALGRDPDHSILLVTVMPGPQLRQATPWCREIRARFPQVPIIWGGYFPTVYPAAVARDPAVDVVVMGQGEHTLRALLPILAERGDPTGLPGTAVWRDGALVTGPERPLSLSSSFGDAAYDRLPMDQYAARTFLGSRTFNHHSSVGCPYVCNFCAVTSMFEGRWLADKPDDVLRIVRRLHKDHGANAIEFHDNNFFAAERRTREIASGMVGLGMRWWGEARIDTMLGWSELTWKTLRESGLAMVFYGAESGDQAALDAMDKGGLQVADIRALNRRAKGHGIIPEFSFVLGNPADPEGDIDRSLRLVEELKDENPDCEIILYLYTPVPLPGMFDKATEQGFAFPETLDDWLSPRWYRYEDRRNPGTPWLTPTLIRRIYDFEAVVHARWPSKSDRNLGRWQRALLRALSTPRQRLRLYDHPYELKLLQRAWSYRRPEEMGF